MQAPAAQRHQAFPGVFNADAPILPLYIRKARAVRTVVRYRNSDEFADFLRSQADAARTVPVRERPMLHRVFHNGLHGQGRELKVPHVQFVIEGELPGGIGLLQGVASRNKAGVKEDRELAMQGGEAP